MSDYNGYPTHLISSRFLELECLETAGPRIIRLSYKGSENLLAELPYEPISTPFGDYHHLGGHRLWHAPEGMPRSYIPDEEGLTLTELPDGAILEGKIEPGTGIQKRIEIHLCQDQPRVVLKHYLTNRGLWEVELAVWALTMCRLGGVEVIPLRADNPDQAGLLPDRHLAIWPYSRIDDPRLKLKDDRIILEAKLGLPPLKIGTFNPLGWIGYWREGILFRKSFEVFLGKTYPDGNCNCESYCNSRFVELETLSPLVRLRPGETVEHTERWELSEMQEPVEFF
jgi:hypothetical protein